MGGGGGPPAITFTINTLFANLTTGDKQSIEDSITEILKELGSGNVTFSEFREGSAIVDASPENFVSAEAVSEVVKAAEDIKTLGAQRLIVAEINEAPVEYTDKLIIVPTVDSEAIIYINDGAEDTVERTDWRGEDIAPDAIKSLAFGNSVTTIGDFAFSRCTSLTQVTIPGSVTTIGDSAFFRCTSLTQVTIPDSVTAIGARAFQQCLSLTQVTIPNSVQIIGTFAFSICTSLTQVTIPDSVTTIGNDAFSLCSSLAKINVDTANDNYSSRDGVLFNKNQTSLIQYPIGNTRTQYPIPNSVTTIGDFAFEGCTSLTQVTIPDTVTTIGAGAFSFCTSLTQVTIPDTVTTIGARAFEECSSLTQVIIPGSVTTIGDRAFNQCTSLASVKLNNTDITTIPLGAFNQCPAVNDPTNFVVANDMPNDFGFEADNGVFSNRSVDGGGLQFGADNSGGAGFKTVKPPAITFTINTLFANLTDEDKESIEESITGILQGLGSGNVTFSEFREGSAIVDASPENFVSAAAVSEVVKAVGDIKTVGTQRFIVASIDEAPVEYTDKLIIVPTVDSEAIIYINDGAEDTVERTDWEGEGIAKDAIKFVAFGNSVTTIGGSAFQECSSLTQVTIPNSVTTIGDFAFALCTRLTQVTIPDSVTTIEQAAFISCTNLASVKLNSDIAIISEDVFNNCPAVNNPTNFVVPNARTQNISFGDFNGDFSNKSTDTGGGLQFGDDDSGGAGFKTVTVTP